VKTTVNITTHSFTENIKDPENPVLSRFSRSKNIISLPAVQLSPHAWTREIVAFSFLYYQRQSLRNVEI
jgi:hypothetical protein